MPAIAPPTQHLKRPIAKLGGPVTEHNMNEPRWLITNALLINEGRTFHADLRVRSSGLQR